MSAINIPNFWTIFHGLSRNVSERADPCGGITIPPTGPLPPCNIDVFLEWIPVDDTYIVDQVDQWGVATGIGSSWQYLGQGTTGGIWEITIHRPAFPNPPSGYNFSPAFGATIVFDAFDVFGQLMTNTEPHIACYTRLDLINFPTGNVICHAGFAPGFTLGVGPNNPKRWSGVLRQASYRTSAGINDFTTPFQLPQPDINWLISSGIHSPGDTAPTITHEEYPITSAGLGTDTRTVLTQPITAQNYRPRYIFLSAAPGNSGTVVGNKTITVELSMAYHKDDTGNWVVP